FRLLGIGPDPDEREGEDVIANYFRLTSAIGAAMQADPIDTALVDRLTNERAQYENTVERYAEKLITEAVSADGLDRRLPLFGDVRITWPPVAFELTAPPQLLVR